MNDSDTSVKKQKSEFTDEIKAQVPSKFGVYDRPKKLKVTPLLLIGLVFLLLLAITVAMLTQGIF